MKLSNLPHWTGLDWTVVSLFAWLLPLIPLLLISLSASLALHVHFSIKCHEYNLARRSALLAQKALKVAMHSFVILVK
jgi:hypothetical protein